jgi:chemotaxis protein histidine kinase CheA
MEKKIDLSLFREKFIQEARDRISRMNSGLVYLGKNPGDSRLEDDILREAHTLKGAARMMGFSKISELSHRFEEALSRRKEGKVASNQDLTDALFFTLDTLSSLVDSLAQTNRTPVDLDGVIDRLRLAQALPEDAPAPDSRAAPSPSATPPAGSPKPPAVESDPCTVPEAGGGIRVDPERLDDLATLLTEAIGCHLRQVELRTLIAEMGRRYRRVGQNLLAFFAEAAEKGTLPAELASQARLLLTEAAGVFLEVARRHPDLARREIEETTALSQVLEDIRSETLAIRMIPLSPLFESFHRVVRELSRELGKDVELVVRGGKTEIDRKVAEALTGPLIHMIRNAVDHGIETPQVRANLNKRLRGRVAIMATPKKGRVVIEVEDDGKGIDLQEVRETAIRKGMISEKVAYRLDDRELLSLIFRPGFSTAGTMTEISGRGIGMDVVRNTAERFNGAVDIASTPGKGTKVTLELPFTMAVSRVLLFRVGGQSFGIPIMHSDGVFRFAARDIVMVEGRKTVPFGEAPVPAVWLSNLLDVGAADYRRSSNLAVIVRHSQRRLALVVDSVEGEFEFIVKDLGTYLKKVPLFMGSSILGTGEIALLLDVYDLMSAIRLRPEEASFPEDEAGAAPGEILVVDDSLLSREMQQRVLSCAGYRVETAPSSSAALDLLARRPFDLLVAGVRMRGMDGVELVGRIRSKAYGKALPVVLVASRDHAEDRERALSAGAQACVEKEDFDVEHVTPVIRRLVGGKSA